MADKLTQLAIDALTRAAADPAGVPLYASKAAPGLFPPTAAAKPAAKKCLDEGWLGIVRTDDSGKSPRELAAVTERGMEYLLSQVSPKTVLEDFVRVLESRRGEVAELVSAAGKIADRLDGLQSAVSAVLPKVQGVRIPAAEVPALPVTEPSFNGTASHRGGAEMPAVAVLEPRVKVVVDELAEALLARLGDWSSSAGAAQDCPLPELFRSLTMRDADLTIGTFHDCLRSLHESGRIYLHPWTGPLYAIPDPAYAMLVGHGIAYYASAR